MSLRTAIRCIGHALRLRSFARAMWVIHYEQQDKQ